MRELLGGKGANVAEMTRVLGAERVPAGFTLTTEACIAYMRGDGLPDFADALTRLEDKAGRRLGEAGGAPRVFLRGGGSVRRATRCSYPCGAARASRCRGCSTPSSTSA